MSAADDDLKGVGRVLDALMALAGYPVTGASNKDLAAAIKATPTQVTRAMAPLIAKGFARKDEGTGRFFPTPLFSRAAFSVSDAFMRSKQRLADLEHSMTGH